MIIYTCSYVPLIFAGAVHYYCSCCVHLL